MRLSNERSKKRLPGPREIRVVQAEYAHETAILTYRYDATLRQQLARGKPVSIRWGWTTHTNEFHGYIHHVTIDGINDGSQLHEREMTVICVGASDAFNQPGFAKFTNARVDTVVADLARRHGFSALLQHHPYAWPLLQQEGQSTWAFLVECAQRVGWGLTVRNTDVRCHSRSIRHRGATILREYGPRTENVRDAIYSFQVVQAETLAINETKRRRTAYGVDTNGMPFTVTTGDTPASGTRMSTPAITEYRDLKPPSVAEAAALLNGEQELNRHHIRARVTAVGNASVHATSTVRLVGIDRDSDGYWYVLRAEHIVTGNNYRMSLQLGKDSYGDPGGSPRRITPGETATRSLVADGVIAASGPDGPPSMWLPDRKRWQARVTTQRQYQPVARPAPIPVKQPAVVSVFRSPDG